MGTRTSKIRFALGALAAAAALFAFPTQAQAGVDTTAPTFQAPFPRLRRNPIRWVPQASHIRAVTDEPTQLFLEFHDGVNPPRRETADATFTTDHRKIPIVGMKHFQTTDIFVIARDPSGNETTYPIPLVWPARVLPQSFPPLTIDLVNTAQMEPGYTMFVTANAQASLQWMIILDDEGDVVWYHHNPNEGGANVELLDNGNFLWSSRRHVMEMTRLGRFINKWYPGRIDGGAGMDADAVFVDTDDFHHEMHPMEDFEEADFLALGARLHVLPNFPDDVVDPAITVATANVITDTIIEFKRDGTIVKELDLVNLLDPYRMCYDGLNTFWSGPNSIYNNVEPDILTRDPFHANAVCIDYSDNTYIVSLRHQEALVKIDRATDQIVWIHGTHERWNAPWDQYLLTPVGNPFEWHFHQHAVEMSLAGNPLIFDNGNWRAVPPAPGAALDMSFSRAVEYLIDPIAMTTRQAWKYGARLQTDPDHFFSRFICDADQLPVTGNVLVTNGGIQEVGVPVRYTELIEVTYTRPPVEVFKATIRDPSDLDNWTVYRAERIPTLYP
jgi:hypothetical protein